MGEGTHLFLSLFFSFRLLLGLRDLQKAETTVTAQPEPELARGGRGLGALQLGCVQYSICNLHQAENCRNFFLRFCFKLGAEKIKKEL